jgi:hypothetical protein
MASKSEADEDGLGDSQGETTLIIKVCQMQHIVLDVINSAGSHMKFVGCFQSEELVLEGLKCVHM